MKPYRLFLLLIFLSALALRLYFSFTTPNFTYESYFHLKHAQALTQSGLPLYHDPLSYGGRNLTFLPAFPYLLSFFALFFPLEIVAKIISALLLASLIPLVYLLAKMLTKKEDAALSSAFIAAFIPSLWQTNSLSSAYLFLPFSLIAIYSFINLPQKKFVYLYLFSILLLSLTSSAAFLLIIGLFFYFFLSKLEGKKIAPSELELALFSLFLFFWLQFLFFKNTLLAAGPLFLWRNVPPQIIQQYFPQSSVLHSIILIGIIPLSAGLFIIYNSLFREKNQNLFLFISLALSTLFLFILNLVELKVTLILLALIFAILFSQFYKLLFQYLCQTRFSKFRIPSLCLLLLLLLLTSAYPSFSSALEQSTPSPEEIKAFLWLKENTPPSAIVLTTLKEGHLLTYLSSRKNFMDDQFSLIKNIELRFDHLHSLFVTKYQTQAIALLNQYNINYIFFSPQAKKEYQTDYLPYLDEKCFELVYSNVVQIYLSKCQLQPAK